MLTVNITTSPRQNPTLDKTIRSLGRSGFENITVFYEPDSYRTSLEVGEVFNAQRFGCFGNWDNALRYSLKKGSDYIMMVQDDVIFHKLAAMILRDSLDPGAGYYSLYLSTHDKRLGVKKTDGWYTHNIGWTPCFWGALCYVIPRASAQRLVEHPRYLAHTDEKRVDCLVGECLLDMNLAMYYHVPSLCDHIGYTSTIGHTISQEHKGYRFSV